MNKCLVIIGAGGHGRVAHDLATLTGRYEKILFLDDATAPETPVAGKVADFEKYVSDSDFIVGIGNNSIREKISNKLLEKGARLTTLIHPSAVIGSDVCIGKGVVIFAGSVINTGASVADGVIINTCSSVDHDCVVGKYAHISVGAHLAGTVTVGERTFIGAGATVINNVSICGDCMIGAGATVIKNITESGTYIGVPAVKIKE